MGHINWDAHSAPMPEGKSCGDPRLSLVPLSRLSVSFSAPCEKNRRSIPSKGEIYSEAKGMCREGMLHRN